MTSISEKGAHASDSTVRRHILILCCIVRFEGLGIFLKHHKFVIGC